MKLFFKPTPSRSLRPTLLALHTSGMLQVFRRHSIFRLWVPLRQNSGTDEHLVGSG